MVSAGLVFLSPLPKIEKHEVVGRGKGTRYWTGWRWRSSVPLRIALQPASCAFAGAMGISHQESRSTIDPATNL